MAYRDVANRRRWSWLEFTESVSFTAGKRFYSLPTLHPMTTVTVTNAGSNNQAVANADGWQIGDIVSYYSPDLLTLRSAGAGIVSAVNKGAPGDPLTSTSLQTNPVVTVATTVGDMVCRAGIGVDNPVLFGRLRPAALALPEIRFIEKYRMTPDYSRSYIDPSVVGQPSAYTIWKNILELFPYPDTTYNYDLYGWTGVQTLVADSDRPLIPAQFEDVLVYGALVHAADQDRDQGLKDDRSRVYEAMILQMYAAEEFTNTESVRKVEMPANYYGMFDDRHLGGRQF